MTFIDLCVLAIVQGLTEFLPVSSSGHLVLARTLLDVNVENPLVVDVALHVGTLLAVVAVYRHDVKELFFTTLRFPGVLLRRQELDASSRMLVALLIGTVPAAIVGITLENWIEDHLARILPVGLALLATSLLLLTANRGGTWGTGKNEIGLGLAFLIGCAQAIAIMPGCSRSGWTIAIAMILGVEARMGAKFSFLLALPAIGGAALLQILRLSSGSASTNFDWVELGGGILLSALTGYAACKLLLLVLRRGALRWFAAYCALAGCLALGSLFMSS